MHFAKSSGNRNSVKRHLGIEPLEARWLLSGTPPTVADVTVSSTDWSGGFLDYLETQNLGDGGYAIPTGSSQLSALPWNNINQIKITFSEDVSVQSEDLSVSGVNTTAYAFSDFSYDDQSYTAVWTLSASLTNDKILLDLDADGSDPVEDLQGNILDGEWSNGVSTFDSGNGVAGGDFQFQMNVVHAEVNGGTLITVSDYVQVIILNGKSTSDPGYIAYRDLDGSGTIDSTDYFYVISQMGGTLPSGDPVGVSDDAPTSSGFADLVVNEDAPMQTVSLNAVFDDLEDEDWDLEYELLSNSNAALFDDITVYESGGELWLDLAADAYGEADLVVRATDSQGLFVDSTLHIVVNPVNDAPVISDFTYINQLGVYTFTGTVTDADDDPAGQTVMFGDVLAGHSTTVHANGTFLFSIELEHGVWGDALAQTQDPLGLLSNVAAVYVL